MKELIKITEQNGKQAVSARELHTFLGSKREFATWIKDRIKKYDLAENQDYVCLTDLSSEGRGGHNKIEYALSLDCAKELSMLEANKKGQEARRYFIECEKKLKEVVVPQFKLPQTMSEALLLAGELAQKVELQAPKVEYYDKVMASKSLISTTIIAKELGMSAITLNKKLNELGVLYKKSGSWVLHHKYEDKDYTGTKTYLHDTGGENKTYQHTYWTEKGRQFIHRLF